MAGHLAQWQARTRCRAGAGPGIPRLASSAAVWPTPDPVGRVTRRAYQNVAVYEASPPALGSFAMSSPHEPDPGELSHLLASLVAFLDEHRYCGELDGVTEDEWVWMTCTSGAVISRTLEPARQ